MDVVVFQRRMTCWNIDDPQFWAKFEPEGMKAKRQPFTNRLQRCFLERPEPKETLQTFAPIYLCDSLCLSGRKVALRHFTDIIERFDRFQIHAHRMSRRPGAEKTSLARGETQPDISRLGEKRPPLYGLINDNFRQKGR